jgi:hypothetical protein
MRIILPHTVSTSKLKPRDPQSFLSTHRCIASKVKRSKTSEGWAAMLFPVNHGLANGYARLRPICKVVAENQKFLLWTEWLFCDWIPSVCVSWNL